MSVLSAFSKEISKKLRGNLGKRVWRLPKQSSQAKTANLSTKNTESTKDTVAAPLRRGAVVEGNHDTPAREAINSGNLVPSVPLVAKKSAVNTVSSVCYKVNYSYDQVGNRLTSSDAKCSITKTLLFYDYSDNCFSTWRSRQ